MRLSLDVNDFIEYVVSQVNTFYPDKYVVHKQDMKRAFNLALERTEYCFSHITVRGYHRDGYNGTMN